MQRQNVPVTDLPYWTALSVASVFGANLGDFVSHDLHMGHVRGLAPLALILAAILLAERQAKSASQAFYWLAIITIRTAATNLADLATHDLRLGYGWVIAGLTALLVTVLIAGRGSNPAAQADERTALPPTNGRYWTAMLLAGTLGTAIGDTVSDDFGIGPGPGSVILGGAMTGVFALRARSASIAPAWYWLAVVAIRAAGTAVGDFSADVFSLPISTIVSGLLFAVCLLLLTKRRLAPALH